MPRTEDIIALYQAALARGREGQVVAGLLAAPSHAADGDNPLCGDHVRVELRIVGGRIVEAGFAGDCCVVCRSSAELLCQMLSGAEVEQLDAFADALGGVLAGAEDPSSEPRFARLLPLREVPQRHRCALLPWAAARAALRDEPTVSTEEDAQS